LGVNNYGVLGSGLNDRKKYQPVLNKYLENFHIVDMSCGHYHTLVLTSYSEVYAWVNNSYGQCGVGKFNESCSVPTHISYYLEICVSVSCGAYHSVILFQRGILDLRVAFSCGSNAYGQLGHLTKTNSNNFQRIVFTGLGRLLNKPWIKKISCGLTHTLLLSTNKSLYFCGSYDSEKQTDCIMKPMRIKHPEKFTDIASYHNSNICVAFSKKSIFYVWGKNKANEAIITEPKETSFKTFVEIFIKYFQVTGNPVWYMMIPFEDSFIRNNHYENEYDEKEKLGAGSYGEVFKVNNKNLKDKYFAVKKMKFKNKNEQELLKELEIFTLISKFDDKNILHYHYFWIENMVKQNGANVNRNNESNLNLYILMDLCEQTLGDFLEMMEEIRLENSNVLSHSKYYISSSIFIEILEGVKYLHKQNPPLIHRDLCPDNILLKIEENDRVVVKIADFGLLTIHKYAEQLHESEKGHIRYIAPEVRNGGNYDTRADIFSLGMVLRNLFDIDSDDEYEVSLKSFIIIWDSFVNFRNYVNDIDSSSLLKSKFENVNYFHESMISDIIEERHDCQEIIDFKDSWYLSAKEFVYNCEVDEFKKVFLLKCESNPFLNKFINIKFMELKKIGEWSIISNWNIKIQFILYFS
jgi:serine/threonine protein kinase